MKKRYIFLLFIVCLFLFLSAEANALIQTSPKYDKIELDVKKTDIIPVADGIINVGEYEKLDIQEGMLSYIVGYDDDLSRVRKTKFNSYAAVNGGKFFFALEYDLSPEYRIFECSTKNMWAQSCLLMSFSKKGSAGRTALELGIRENEDYVWRNAEGYDKPNYDYAVKYDNGTFTYEFSIELSSFCDENDNEFLFCFSISVGNYFDSGKFAYIQLGKGISGFSTPENADAGKDASIFPVFKIYDKTEPAVTETEPESEAETETQPAVPDAGEDKNITIIVLFAAVFLILTGMSIKFAKKYKVNYYSY